MDRVKRGCYLKAKWSLAEITKGSVYKVKEKVRDTIILEGMPDTGYDPSCFTFWSEPDRVDWEQTFTEAKQRMDKRVDDMRTATASSWTVDTAGLTKRHNQHHGWKSYEFDIRSLDQIDEDQIRKDLSWTNPMMILECDDDDAYVQVFIDSSIWDKACASGSTEKTMWHGHFEYDEHVYYERLHRYLSDCGRGHGWVHRRFLKGLIALVKEIKNAQWNEPRNTTCTVRKISI